jgi:hypothetical protein
MAATIAVSRRSVMRRQLEALPRFFASNRNPTKLDSSDRSLLAVEAFGLATLNVTSFGIMLTGGIAYAFDLSSLRELKQRSKAAISKPGKVSPEDEKELQEMMDGLLAKLGMEIPKGEQAVGTD